MSVTTFGGKVRMAGTLDDDNLIRIGSIRSFKRFDNSMNEKSNLDDSMVASKLKFEQSDALKESSKSEEKENVRKSSHRHHHHHHRHHHSKKDDEKDREHEKPEDGEHHRRHHHRHHHHHRDGSAARSHSKAKSREDKEKPEGPIQRNKDEVKEAQPQTKEEDLMESLRRINSNRRLRRQVNGDTFTRTKDEEHRDNQRNSSKDVKEASRDKHIFGPSHSQTNISITDEDDNRKLMRNSRKGSLDIRNNNHGSEIGSHPDLPSTRGRSATSNGHSRRPSKPINGFESSPPPSAEPASSNRRGISKEKPKQPDSESDDDQTVAVDIAKPKQTNSTKNNNLSDSIERTSLNNDFGLEYFKLIRDTSMLNFILTPPPQGYTIRCKIICQKGIFNQYSFYLEDSDRNDILLMKTHRLVTTNVKQVITCVDREAFGSSEIQCAKIKSNISRKKFKLDLESSVASKNQNEILNISFKSNISEPRRIFANTSLCAGLSGTDHIVTYFFKNRQPYYDFQQKKFVLDYCGRARQSSKNNFQIVDESYPDDIILQLGKVETGWYNCDFAFPLCALQAFGFALSSLSR